jgi:arylsulfatase A-like enzyme
VTDRPNVLLLVLDSVRAANCSLYGHVHETTPELERLADEAVVYEEARSPGTWSLPSHTSLFTGYHVLEHGVTRARHRLEPGHTVWETLGDRGYATGVFSENTWITDMGVGLKDAFETVEGARNLPFPDAVDPSNFVLSEGQGQYLAFLRHCLDRGDAIRSLVNGVVTKLAWDQPRLLPNRFSTSTPAGVYADLFLDWQAERDGPWAACVNFMDGHLPYLPDDEHDRWGGTELRDLQNGMDDQVWEFNGGRRPWWQRTALEGLYDGAIHEADAAVGQIVDRLRERGALDDTLLVVTSDHGEGFGEPSHIRGDRDAPAPNARVAAHGAGIHEVLTHVPLVVRPPGGRAERIDVPASLTEFPAAVRDALDGDRPSFVPDGSVLASSHGLEEPMEERARRYAGDLYRFNGDCRAVYEPHDDDVRKFVGWRERRATVDAFGASCSVRRSFDDGGRVDETFGGIEDRGVREEGAGVEDVDEATKQRLEDLGYA